MHPRLSRHAVKGSELRTCMCMEKQIDLKQFLEKR